MSHAEIGSSEATTYSSKDRITGEDSCGTNACVGTLSVTSAETDRPFIAVYDTKQPAHVEAAAVRPPISAERAVELGMLCFRAGDEWPKFIGEVQTGQHHYATPGTGA
jgi:hypothetical protein